MKIEVEPGDTFTLNGEVHRVVEIGYGDGGFRHLKTEPVGDD